MDLLFLSVELLQNNNWCKISMYVYCLFTLSMSLVLHEPFSFCEIQLIDYGTEWNSLLMLISTPFSAGFFSSSGLQFSRGWFIFKIRGDSYFGIRCFTCDTAALFGSLNLVLEILVLTFDSCKSICDLFLFTFQIGVIRGQFDLSLNSFQSRLIGRDSVGFLGASSASRLENANWWIHRADALDLG